jgi:hypothetical protein
MPNDSGLPIVVDALAFSAAGLPLSGSTPAGVLFGTGIQANGPITTPESGSAARMGTAVLNGTSAVSVTAAAVTAASRIFLTIQAPGGTPGAPYVNTITPGTGFTVKSSAADTSTVAWLLVDHT